MVPAFAAPSRQRPRSAVPPMTAPSKMVRAASPAAAPSSSSMFAPNRDWELDRVRRLMYEQQCGELRGQLQAKEAEIETIRQEKTRITKVWICVCLYVGVSIAVWPPTPDINSL